MYLLSCHFYVIINTEYLLMLAFGAQTSKLIKLNSRSTALWKDSFKEKT